MDRSFWQARWDSGQIGFHQPAGSPQLQRHWAATGLLAGSAVLVPLCGKSVDLAWLAALGHRVVGVELAPAACAAFFAEQGWPFQTAQRGAMQVWRASGRDVELWCGDFFDFDGDGQLFGGWFDRAALIALPAAMRDRYTRHLQSLLAPQARGLLVTLDYPQALRDGPPFAVPPAAVAQLWGGAADLAQLDDEDLLTGDEASRWAGLPYARTQTWRVALQDP